MILADKIVSLRKKAGWSQEDLAEKLGVTRQSVSKWEGAQSVPDMDKVVMMSRLFGVSTDFLLKDELEEETPCAAAQDDDTPLRRVSLTQASAYLALRKAAAPKIAIATALCITSPVTLLLLAAMSEVQRFPISGNAAAGIGLCVMLVLLAVAVSIFLRADADVRDYRFLEEEPFETEYGVTGMVRQRQREYKDTHTRLVTVGVVLCAGRRTAVRRHVHKRQRPALYRRCLRAAGAGGHRLSGPGHSRRVSGRHGAAAGGGRLHPSPEKAPQADGHRHHDLLAHRHGGVPAVHLRSPRQRPTPVQLDHLGGGGRAVCRRYGHRSHHQPQPRLMMPHNRSLGEK